ncbi:hypothetical protein XELAEV_18033255mg [Xenopus laevis]|uniref:Uncharacterized protein n=1 Tax=Xenopus laevis TaxID=8355 RepID=A0A974CJK3_XENLA|nr:hypothetical protein XELAEV_18033255mg [Xenopus laevis]
MSQIEGEMPMDFEATRKRKKGSSKPQKLTDYFPRSADNAQDGAAAYSSAHPTTTPVAVGDYISSSPADTALPSADSLSPDDESPVSGSASLRSPVKSRPRLSDTTQPLPSPGSEVSDFNSSSDTLSLENMPASDQLLTQDSMKHTSQLSLFRRDSPSFDSSTRSPSFVLESPSFLCTEQPEKETKFLT